MGERKWIKWRKIYFQMLFLKFVRIFMTQTICRENKILQVENLTMPYKLYIWYKMAPKFRLVWLKNQWFYFITDLSLHHAMGLELLRVQINIPGTCVWLNATNCANINSTISKFEFEMSFCSVGSTSRS